jgi:DNA-binding response OmpR family regulator
MCKGVQILLCRFGYETEVVSSQEVAYRRAATTEYALILVELCLGKNEYGTALIRQLRTLNIATPIAMYTALDNEMYEIAALDAGADDFILKSSSVPRFIARVEALIRADQRRHDSNQTNKRRIAIGRAVLDKDAHVFELDGKAVRLTLKEAGILDLLSRQPQQIVSTGEILKRIWGAHAVVSENAVHCAIRRLRRKLDKQCALRGLISWRYGRGFCVDWDVLAPPSR